jgi:hypothetical protein
VKEAHAAESTIDIKEIDWYHPRDLSFKLRELKRAVGITDCKNKYSSTSSNRNIKTITWRPPSLLELPVYEYHTRFQLVPDLSTKLQDLIKIFGIVKTRLPPPCILFNNPEGCSIHECPDFAICALCGFDDHGMSTCEKRVLCIEFAYDRCSLGLRCTRSHHCPHCHGPHSLIRGCDLFEERVSAGEKLDGYCLLWNSGNRCNRRTAGGCDKIHSCLFCRDDAQSPHRSCDCRHAISTLIDLEFGGLNEGI